MLCLWQHSLLLLRLRNNYEQNGEIGMGLTGMFPDQLLCSMMSQQEKLKKDLLFTTESRIVDRQINPSMYKNPIVGGIYVSYHNHQNEPHPFSQHREHCSRGLTLL